MRGKGCKTVKHPPLRKHLSIFIYLLGLSPATRTALTEPVLCNGEEPVVLALVLIVRVPQPLSGQI